MGEGSSCTRAGCTTAPNRTWARSGTRWRRMKKRHIAAGGVDCKRSRIRAGPRRHRLQFRGRQTVKVKAELLSSVPPVAPLQGGGDPACGEIHRTVRLPIPGRGAQAQIPAQPPGGVWVKSPCSGPAAGSEAVPRPSEPAKLLHQFPLPAGDGGDQLFQHPGRAGPAPVVNRIGHVRAQSAGIERGDHSGGDQVTQVRHRPLRTEIDESILPKAVRTASAHGAQARENLHETAQDSGRVALAIQLSKVFRDERPDFFGEITVEMVVRVVHQAAAFPFRITAPAPVKSK